MRKKCFGLLSISFVLVFLWSGSAVAASEYYTFGGFVPVTMAFENIARIFASGSYKAYIFIFMLFGMFVGGGTAIYNMATGVGKSAISWLLPLLVGYGLLVGFFFPKDTMTIYDPVLNQNKVIGDIPIGVSKVASGLNSVERMVIDLIDSSSSHLTSFHSSLNPVRYAENGGTVGLDAVVSIAGGSVPLSDGGERYAKQMNKYIEDCVSFEITRPGTTMSEETLLRPGPGVTLIEEFKKADSPANFTTSYEDNPSTGSPASCNASYAELKNYYSNTSNFNRALSHACASGNIMDFGRCQQIMNDWVSYTTGESMDARLFISSAKIAQQLGNYVAGTGGTLATALVNAKETAIDKGFLSGLFNPIMINGYAAYTIALIPLIAMFLPVMWKKTTGLIVSMLAWNMIVRCLDCVLFHFWSRLYFDAVEKWLQSSAGFGMESSLLLGLDPSIVSFASLRGGVFLLATVISGALFKFSDSSLSRLSDKAERERGVAGIGTSRTGAEEYMSQAKRSGSTMSVAAMESIKSGSDVGFGAVGKAVAAEDMSALGASAGKFSASNNDIKSHTANSATVANRKAAQDQGDAHAKSERVSRVDGTNKGAATTAAVNVLNDGGKTAYNLAKAETEYNKGTTEGKDKAVAVAREAFGFQGGRDDYAAMMSEMKSIKDFSDSAGLKSIAEKYFGGGEKGMAGAARFLKQASEVSHAGQYGNTSKLVAAYNGDAAEAGFTGGTASATATMQTIQDQKAKLNMLGKEAGEEIKSDPNLYQTDKNLRGNAIELFDKQTAKSAGVNQAEEKAIDKTLQQAEQNLNKGDLTALKNEPRQAMAVGALLGKSVDQLTKDDIGRARGAVQQAREKGAARNAVRNALRAPESAENKLAATLGNEQWRQANGGEAAFGKMQQKPVQRADGSTVTQYSWTDQSGTRHTAMATEDGRIRSQATSKDGVTSTAVVNPNTGKESQIQSTDAAGNSLGATAIGPNTGRAGDLSPQSNEVLPESLRSSIAAAPTGFEKPAAPVDTRDGKQVMKELTSDLRSGDYGAIEKDAGKMAMVRNILGKDASEEVTRDDIKAASAALAEDDKSGRVTAAGELELMKGVSDANLPAFVKPDTGYGAVKRKVVAGVGSSDEGAMSAGPSKERSALAAELAGAGWKHVAKAIESTSTPFNFTINRDKDNNITGFEAMGGARSLSSDMATINSGRLVDYTNLTKSTVGRQEWSGESIVREETNIHKINQGLRREVGDQSWTGSRKVDENTDVSLNQNYAKIDRTLGAKKDAKLIQSINKTLESRGSEQRVQPGMMLTAMIDRNSGELTTWDIKSGGESVTKDLTTKHTGKQTREDRNSTTVTQGTSVTGSGTKVIEKVAEKAGLDETTTKYVSEVGATVFDITSKVGALVGGVKSAGSAIPTSRGGAIPGRGTGQKAPAGISPAKPNVSPSGNTGGQPVTPASSQMNSARLAQISQANPSSLPKPGAPRVVKK